jgi:hypothetical protein
VARVKQGSGSGDGVAATPPAGTRASRARASNATVGAPPTDGDSPANPEVLGNVPTPLEDGEDDNSDLDESELPPTAELVDASELDGDPNQRMPDYARPGAKAVDASPAPRATPAPHATPAPRATPSGRSSGTPVRQSFAGKYVALARLNLDDGTVIAPDAEVHLDDAAAQHFLKHKVVRSVGRRAPQRGVRDLPAGQNFGGRYRALARLRHDDDARSTPPGAEVALTDAEARHYLASGVVEPISGYAL